MAVGAPTILWPPTIKGVGGRTDGWEGALAPHPAGPLLFYGGPLSYYWPGMSSHPTISPGRGSLVGGNRRSPGGLCCKGRVSIVLFLRSGSLSFGIRTGIKSNVPEAAFAGTRLGKLSRNNGYGRIEPILYFNRVMSPCGNNRIIGPVY